MQIQQPKLRFIHGSLCYISAKNYEYYNRINFYCFIVMY